MTAVTRTDDRVTRLLPGTDYVWSDVDDPTRGVVGIRGPHGRALFELWHDDGSICVDTYAGRVDAAGTCTCLRDRPCVDTDQPYPID